MTTTLERTKLCPDCKRELSLSQFSFHTRANGTIGPDTYCSECSSARSVDYMARLKESDPQRYAEYAQALSRHKKRRNDETLRTASNWKTEWTWSQNQILLDEKLSNAAAAVLIGRSLKGVEHQRGKLRELYHVTFRGRGMQRRLPRIPD